MAEQRDLQSTTMGVLSSSLGIVYNFVGICNARDSHEDRKPSDSFIHCLILLHEKFLQCDWLRGVVFQLNLKYLHVKITKLLQVIV